MEVTRGTEPLHRVRSPRRAGWAGCTAAAALTASAAALTAAARTASPVVAAYFETRHRGCSCPLSEIKYYINNSQ